ncbi:acyltransferase family protein [Nocardiopsis halotolerans]|uniref:acyltransferase family protein n=1 Tax=Nocardiopsis halotolerans TaxID=124252 RepID=UPI00034C6F37|nr:acyltransferase family protein [Nocardiopsis halotolerans]
MTAVGSAPSAPRPRLPWIDTVRVALTVLVLAHHAAITYSHIPIWYYHEAPQDPSAFVLDLLIVTNQSYFMGLFFLVSGYFVPGSLDRKGPRVFARDRLIRLGLPLLAFVLIVRPLAGLHAWFDDPRGLSYPMYYLVTIDAGPAWFLEVLLILSLAYAGLAAASTGRRRAWKDAGSGIDTPASSTAIGTDSLRRRDAAGVMVGLMGVMAPAMVLWRQVVPDGTFWPVVGLPTPSFLPQYVLMFAVGVLAARRRWLERMPDSVAVLGAAASVLAIALLGPHILSPAPAAANIASGIAMSVLGVGLSAVVLVVIRRLSPGSGPVRRFLSANAFAVYVIHPAVLVGLALALQGLVAPAVVKFTVLVPLGVLCCWGLAALLRRISLVARIM